MAFALRPLGSPYVVDQQEHVSGKWHSLHHFLKAYVNIILLWINLTR